MAKNKIIPVKTTYTFDEMSIENIDKIVDSGLGGELGVFKAGDNHFTFGNKTLGSHEVVGKGLPPKEDNFTFHKEFQLCFDIRLSHDEEGNVELLIAGKDMATHFKFPFKGLSEEQAHKALIEFEEQTFFRQMRRAIYNEVWAYYRKQDENLENQNESYDKIMANLEVHFKKILKWNRDKIIEQRKENGVLITKSVPIQRGTKPQTKAVIEKEKQDFIKAVFYAFNEIGSGRKTQLDVGLIVFERESNTKEEIDIPSRMKHALRKYKLNFKELLKEYKQKKADNSI